MNLAAAYLRARLQRRYAAADLDEILPQLVDAEQEACARLGRLPPAQLAGRLAFARELDWSPLSALAARQPIRILAAGPGQAIAGIAALFLPRPPTTDDTAPCFAFLQSDDTLPALHHELAALRARGIPVLAPWAELPACPPQDVASDLFPQLVSFCLAVA